VFASEPKAKEAVFASEPKAKEAVFASEPKAKEAAAFGAHSENPAGTSSAGTARPSAAKPRGAAAGAAQTVKTEMSGAPQRLLSRLSYRNVGGGGAGAGAAGGGARGSSTNGLAAEPRPSPAGGRSDSGGMGEVKAAEHPLSTRGIYSAPASLRSAAGRILATIAAVAAVFMVLTALQAWLAVAPGENGDGAGNGEITDPEEPGSRRGSTVGSAILTFLRAVVVIVGLLVVLHHAGVRTTTLFALASILSLVIGLAAQSALADHFAGLIFLTEGQLHIGDFVHLVMGPNSSSASASASGHALTSGSSSTNASAASAHGMLSGTVQDVTLRRVRLTTFDNETIYVPNSRVLAVINASQQFPIVRLRVRLPVGSDLGAAARAVAEECEAMRSDPELLALLPSASAASSPAAEMRLVRALDAAGMRSPGPEVLGVGDIGGADYELGVRFMTRVNRQWAAARVVRRRLLARMQAEGVSGIPQLVSVSAAPPAAA
jgi:small-conductance mechanosensitive channel